MREQEHVARARTDPGNHVIRAGAHRCHGFPTRATVLEQTPAGTLGQCRAPAFARAVVSLQQIGIGLCVCTEPCRFARSPGPPQRTGEHVGERHASQPRAQLLRVSLPPFGELIISAAGVLTVDRPGGLAMPDKTNLLKSPAHTCDETVLHSRYSQPFVNPARRSPVTTYGHARINRQSKPDR